MKRPLQVLEWLYARCLRLYPPGFRDEYGEELEAVFALALHDAAPGGVWSVLRLLGRELWGLPVAIVRAYGRERRRSQMWKSSARMLTFEQGSRRETAAALAPFLIFGAVPTLLSYLGLFSSTPQWFEVVVAVALLAALAGMFLLGIANGIPRWALPYLGMALALFSVYAFFDLFSLSHLAARLHAATDSAFLRQISFQLAHLYARSKPWTMRQIAYQGQLWLGLPVTALFLTVISALLPPLRPLYRRLRDDWTLLSFLLYGATWFALFLTFDDYQHEEPYQVLGWALLAGGAWLYLRSSRRWQRMAALLGGMTLAMAVAAAGKAMLYASKNWPGPRYFTWQSEGASTLIMFGWLALALLTPMLLMLLPRGRNVRFSTGSRSAP